MIRGLPILSVYTAFLGRFQQPHRFKYHLCIQDSL